MLAITLPTIAVVQLITGVDHPSAAISDLGSLYAVFFVLLGLAAAIWLAAFLSRARGVTPTQAAHRVKA